MGLRCRRILAFSAAACWLAVLTLGAAGALADWGDTPGMGRLFSILLAGATSLTIAAVIGYAITPLTAGHGIGARAAMRAARENGSRRPGKHAARDDTPEGRVIEMFQHRGLTAAGFRSSHHGT